MCLSSVEKKNSAGERENERKRKGGAEMKHFKGETSAVACMRFVHSFRSCIILSVLCAAIG